MSTTMHQRWHGPVVLKRVSTVSEFVNTADDRAFALAFQGLTAHRQRMVRMLAHGMTRTEMAEALFLEMTTVKNTMTLIYRALGISGRPYAAAKVAYLLGRYDRERERTA